MDVATLAAVVGSQFLLPYAKQAFDKFGSSMAEEIGTKSFELVKETSQKVWNKVKSVFTSDGQEAVFAQLEENPDDSIPLIKTMLAKKLEQNPELAKELEALVNQKDETGKTASSLIQNSGVIGQMLNIQNSNFSGSSNAQIANTINNLPSTKDNK